MAFAQQVGHDLAMKSGEPRRGKTARLPQRPATALVQVDQQIDRTGQLVQPLDRMEHGPAGIEKVPLAAADLLAMALGQTRRGTRPRSPASRRASNSAPDAGGPRCHVRPGGGSVRRRSRPPHRRCRVRAGPMPARGRRPRRLRQGNRRWSRRPGLGRPGGKGRSRSRSRPRPSRASGSPRPTGWKTPGTRARRRPARRPGRRRPAPSAAATGPEPNCRSAATSAKATSKSETARRPPAGPIAGHRAPIPREYGTHRPAWQPPESRSPVKDAAPHNGPFLRPALQEAAPAVEEPEQPL